MIGILKHVGNLKRMRVTMVASAFAAAMILTAALTRVDLIKVEQQLVDATRTYRVSTVLSALAMIGVGLMVDGIRWSRRKRHQMDMEAQKLRTLQATMRTVQGIVNNFLNALLLFELEAGAAIPATSFDQLDEQIQQTYQELQALADLKSVVEKPLATGAGIEYGKSPQFAIPSQEGPRTGRLSAPQALVPSAKSLPAT